MAAGAIPADMAQAGEEMAGPWGTARLAGLPAIAAGLGRIVLGLMWQQELHWKRPEWLGGQPNWGCGAGLDGGLCFYIIESARHPFLAPYSYFADSVIRPNIGILGGLVFLGELTCAVLLILGLLTRLGGLLGAVQSLNLLLLLAKVPNEWYWSYVMMLTLHVLLATLGAGRYLGLDHVIVRYLDRVAPLARPGAGPAWARALRWLV